MEVFYFYFYQILTTFRGLTITGRGPGWGVQKEERENILYVDFSAYFDEVM